MPSVAVQPAPLSRRPFGQNYAFVVVAVIFVALLSSAGLRARPGVPMLPLQTAFGWNVGVISLSAAIGIFLYGLAGPFAAAVMQRFGIRRAVLGALALMSAATSASYFMTVPWQLWIALRYRLRRGRQRARRYHSRSLVHHRPRSRHGIADGERRDRRAHIHSGPRGPGRMGGWK